MTKKQKALQIYKDAVEAVLPQNFISKNCILKERSLFLCGEEYKLEKYKNLYVFGSGKAAYTMAYELEKILGSEITGGLIVSPSSKEKLQFIEHLEGSHPIPTQKSIDSTKKLLKMIQNCSENDLFLYLLSGGSSSLIELPIEPISLEDLQLVTDLMLKNALNIHEINVIRKHLSQIKGGKLLQNSRAKGVVLILSDVLDDDLYTIGSAPTYADRSSYLDVKNILEDKNIFHRLPCSVIDVIERGLAGDIAETPKEPKTNISHYILASNSLALEIAKNSAEKLALSVKSFPQYIFGDVDEVARKILQELDEAEEECLVLGGECVVEVKGKGSGGRNQHLALLMLQKMCTQEKKFTFLSAGTDGIDGDTDAAGALIDGKSCEQALLLDLDSYVKNCDSNSFFKQSGDLIVTGSSGTNVMDIVVVIK